ncbi:SDR family oxidoreductase [Bacteroides xylanisolvens]|jgi:enoyl-[acyl-carrier-protein] reductase (NADH)|uniref:SDR family oxidoreductase n=1 Tax=Bacteroides TaxID=816 RepID=UPI0032BF291B|nr:SDR family oxidoreductase [Bacteroides thetaiotaomicron]
MVNPMELTGKKILFVGDFSSLDNAIIEQLKELGGQVIECSKLTMDSVEGVIKDLAKNVGPFDGIVYGVVHSDFKPLQFVKPELVDSLMHDNYGMFIEVMRVLKKSRGIANGASIVAMSSISSIRAMKAKMVFCSAKAALDAAVRCLAVELGDKGIRINSVQKGGVDADFDKDYIQDVTAINENATEQKQILGLTRAIEVANIVAFLLSDAATTITGTSIVIDGGYTL